MDTFSNIFDIVIIFGGVMLIYYSEQMRVNDLIKVGIMIPPSVNLRALKDREGFKKYAFPRHFFQGLVLVLLGLVGIGCDLYGRSDLHIIVYIVVLAFYLICNFLIEKGKKKFYK